MSILKEIPPAVIVLVVVIILVLVFFSISLTDLISKQQKYIKSPVLLTVLEEEVNIEMTEIAGKYVYDLEMPFTLIYPGGFDLDGEKLDEMVVSALIDFKQSSAKADVDNHVEYDNTIFEITKDENFEGIFSTIITSNYPPSKRFDTSTYTSANEPDGLTYNYESIILKSENREFRITIDDIGSNILFGCFAAIDIDCGEPIAKLNIKKMSDCEEHEKYKCDKYIEACDSEIHLSIDDLKCDGDKSERWVKLNAEVNSKNDEEYLVKDNIYVHFWVASERCIQTYSTFESLRNVCGEKYYIGTETVETSPLTE